MKNIGRLNEWKRDGGRVTMCLHTIRGSIKVEIPQFSGGKLASDGYDWPSRSGIPVERPLISGDNAERKDRAMLL